MFSLPPVRKGNQEWANVIVDNEDRYEECTAGMLGPIRQARSCDRSAGRETEGTGSTGRLRHEGAKKLRDPQDVLIETELEAEAEEATGTARENSATIPPPGDFVGRI